MTNNTVLVPNAKLSQSIVTNYDSPDHELVVTIEASVDYASDLDRVERIATEVARDVMHTVPGGVAAASIRSCGSTRSATPASASP